MFEIPVKKKVLTFSNSLTKNMPYLNYKNNRLIIFRKTLLIYPENHIMCNTFYNTMEHCALKSHAKYCSYKLN
jgi:hypothetical protein